MSKICFGGLDMLKPNAIEPTKMPRTALIGVVRDRHSGYLNAAPYSGGVTCLQPLHVLFGVKGAQAMEAFRLADEFCVAVPNREQIEHVWRMALEVPHGIDEIEIAGWHTLAPRAIQTPGIDECVLNLECKKAAYFKLPPPWRAIIIGEVVGVHIESRLLGMNRAEAANLYPIHEAGSHPETGLYSPSHLGGDLVPAAGPAPAGNAGTGKRVLAGLDLFRPENEPALIRSIFPRPTYILMTRDDDGRPRAELISGGSLQSNEPAVQIPVSRASASYRNLRRAGEYVVSIPDRALLQNIEQLESSGGDLGQAGFSLLEPNTVNVPGIAECPVSMDCKAVILEDVPGTDYALLVGRKIGVTLDAEIANRLDLERHTLRDRLTFVNNLYSRYVYAVMDCGMVRKWGFQDPNTISVPPLPSWGSRYTGGWWGPGPSIDFWLIELCQEGLISRPEYLKISYALDLWNDGNGVAHLAEFFTPQVKAELRERLTRLLHLMAWAHRDYQQWDLVHQVLNEFPEQPRDHHSGPVYHERWYGRV